jgi:hypothetical protein
MKKWLNIAPKHELPGRRWREWRAGVQKISGTILLMRTHMFSRFTLMNKKGEEVGLGV